MEAREERVGGLRVYVSIGRSGFDMADRVRWERAIRT